MKKLLSGFVLVAIACALHAQQPPQIEWAKCLGGSGDDEAHSIQQTTDGGYIIAGQSESNDGDISGNHGSNDYWIVKIDSDGNLVWQKCLGGSTLDEAWSIQTTTDGGFILAGRSYSNDGDVTGHHGSTSYSDIWVVKLDSLGNISWEKSLGGIDIETAFSVFQANDGGYILAGFTVSHNGDVSGNHSPYPVADYWIVKLDTVGNLVWQKCLGGTNDDEAFSIQPTSDGGYIVAGSSYSNDDDVSGNHGDRDCWIVKLDLNGSLEWQKSLGGSATDDATTIQQTIDGGYIVGGSTSSNDGDVLGNHGVRDFWILKLDTVGNLVWQRCLGGTGDDQAFSIQQTIDDGFIVAGLSSSTDGDVSINYGINDFWIVKLDTGGNLIWQKSLGGSSLDEAFSIQQTTDSGYIVAGRTRSNDDDVYGNHGGLYDYWIVKLSPEIPTAISSPSTNSISLHPNPVQNLLTISLANQATNATIHVYDLQGRIQDCELRIASFELNSIQLNTTSLPSGFYTLQITNNKTGESNVGKFVKQ